MNILFITEFYSSTDRHFTGGVEARCHHLIKRLEKDHNVYVVSRPKIKVNASWTSIFYRLLFQISSVFRALKFDAQVVEGSNFVTYLPAFITARIKRANAIAWFADVYGKTWFTTMSLPVALAGFVTEWISLKLPWNSIIAMSHATKAKLIKAGVDPQKITVIYGGVDVKHLDQINIKRFKDPTIITASRLVNYKRIDDLVAAYSIVKKTIPNLKLIVCGDGPERLNLEKSSHQLNNHNLGSDNKKEKQSNQDVLFTGNLPQEELYKLMKQAHLFSLPSSVEGFGLVSIEAMACGLPFVSSDIPPTREITHGGKGGFLYPVGNVQMLAKKISLLMSDQKLYAQKTIEAKSIINNFDWPKIIAQTEDVFDRSA